MPVSFKNANKENQEAGLSSFMEHVLDLFQCLELVENLTTDDLDYTVQGPDRVKIGEALSAGEGDLSNDDPFFDKVVQCPAHAAFGAAYLSHKVLDRKSLGAT